MLSTFPDWPFTLEPCRRLRQEEEVRDPPLSAVRPGDKACSGDDRTSTKDGPHLLQPLCQVQAALAPRLEVLVIHAPSHVDLLFMTGELGAPPKLSLKDTALFFDVDGTLVAIEQEPDAVKVSAELRALLERLIAASGGALALVSGRSIEQLDRLFRPLSFSASGLHGLERRLLPGEIERATPAETGMDAAKLELQRYAGSHPGTFVEDKGLTLALHYRMAAQHRETAAALVRKLVKADPEGLVLLEGKMVFELKPPGFDKGRAIADFMQEPPFQGRRPIFAGDDVTDEAGFLTINRLDGIAVKVGVDERPTEAGYGLDGVETMVAWLDDLAGVEGQDSGEGA